MPSYVTPRINTEFVFTISLVDQANRPQFVTNPSIAAGDFQVSTDGGALTNLATLPTVTPAGSKVVQVTLSPAEMNGDNITVVASDAAGDEWDDVKVLIQTTSNQIDDLSKFISASDPVIVGTNNDKTGYELNPTEHTAITTEVWSATTRTLTSFGTLIADIWSYVTRTLTEASGTPYAVATGTETIELPSSGFEQQRIYLFTFDNTGASANADTTPLAAVVNEDGTDRSGNFVGGVVNDGPGIYYQVYQTDPNHEVEQLTFTFSMTIGGIAITTGHIALALNTASVLDDLQAPIPEITGAADIPSTPTIKQALMLLYMDRRNNNLASNAQRQIMNDSGATVISAPMTDDTVTFRQGKLG